MRVSVYSLGLPVFVARYLLVTAFSGKVEGHK